EVKIKHVWVRRRILDDKSVFGSVYKARTGKSYFPIPGEGEPLNRPIRPIHRDVKGSISDRVDGACSLGRFVRKGSPLRTIMNLHLEVGRVKILTPPRSKRGISGQIFKLSYFELSVYSHASILRG